MDHASNIRTYTFFKKNPPTKRPSPTRCFQPCKKIALHDKPPVYFSEDNFFTDLESWVHTEDGSIKTDRIKAKEIILLHLRNKETFLNLAELQLHTIPPLYVFTHVESLSL